MHQVDSYTRLRRSRILGLYLPIVAHLKDKLDDLHREPTKVDQKVNNPKIKYILINLRNERSFLVAADIIETKLNFIYLGSNDFDDGGASTDVDILIQKQVMPFQICEGMKIASRSAATYINV